MPQDAAVPHFGEEGENKNSFDKGRREMDKMVWTCKKKG
jgi:hypothetical protein